MSRYQLTRAKYLSEPEVLRLREILARFSVKAPRDCLMIRLALETGGRAQEVLNLTRSDVDYEHQAVCIKGIKDSNDREIPLSPDTWAEVLGHIASMPADQQRLFNITYRRLEQIWREYRPTPKKFHALRHTFAIRLYRSCRDILIVKTALGHRNIANTMVYLEYDNQAHMQAAIVVAVAS